MKLKDIDIITEMTKDEFLSDAENAIDLYNKEMKKLFPESEYLHKAYMTKNLGPSVIIEFADKDWNVTVLNSKRQMQFIMHLTSNFGKVPDEMDKFFIELNNWHYMLKRKGLKFRKISGKSPSEAMKKLIMWFKNNKDIIESEGK